MKELKDIVVTVKSNERSNSRFMVLMKAQYFLNDQWNRYRECLIIDISRDGACIKLPSDTKISLDELVNVELFSKENESVQFSGPVKWIRRSENALIAGIKLKKLLDDKTLSSIG